MRITKPYSVRLFSKRQNRQRLILHINGLEKQNDRSSSTRDVDIGLLTNAGDCANCQSPERFPPQEKELRGFCKNKVLCLYIAE